MDWQVIFTVAFIIAGSWSLGIAYLLWQHLNLSGARPLMLMSIATAAWSLIYTLELQSAESLETLILWERMKYLGEVFVPVAWLAFAMSYARGGKIQWRYIVFMIIPLISLLIIFFNPLQLFWQTLSLSQIDGFTRLNIEYGTWYLIYRIYSLLLLLSGFILVLLYRRDARERFMMGMACFFPVLIWGLNATLTLLVDISPVAFTLSTTIIVFGILQLGVFDLVPEAFDTLIMNMPDGVLVLDTQNRVLTINPTLSQELGMSPKQIIGKRANELFPIETNRYAEIFQQREAVREIEMGERHVEVRIVPLYEGTSYSGRAILFRDITQRKRTEQELQSRAEELQQLYQQVSELEQMKTDMIRMAAHDLKNPIGVMLGYLEMAQGDLDKLPPVAQGHIHASRQAAWRANSMLSDILSLERIEHLARDGARTEVNLYELLGELIAQYREPITRGGQTLQIDVTVEEDEAIVLGDSPQLAEAISNLITNASKYSPQAGTIQIRLWREQDTLYFETRDNGYGIPLEMQKRLFSPFYRALSEETAHIQGTGLGLHLVKNIVERHGGKVYFHSEQGQGSIFGFQLPVHLPVHKH